MYVYMVCSMYVYMVWYVVCMYVWFYLCKIWITKRTYLGSIYVCVLLYIACMYIWYGMVWYVVCMYVERVEPNHKMKVWVWKCNSIVLNECGSMNTLCSISEVNCRLLALTFSASTVSAARASCSETVSFYIHTYIHTYTYLPTYIKIYLKSYIHTFINTVHTYSIIGVTYMQRVFLSG